MTDVETHEHDDSDHIHVDGGNVMLTIERFTELLNAERMLQVFVQHGVENWDGFEEAIEVIANGYDDEEDGDRELTEEDIAAFECLDCDNNTLFIQEYYMLDFDLWDQIHPENKGMLCIACVEKRLGRQLTSADFTSAPVNDVEWQKARGCSELLLSRLES